MNGEVVHQGRRRAVLVPPQGRIEGEITLPGSKSCTNRALLMASLTAGESEILNPSHSDDSEAMCAALLKLGVEIQRLAGYIRVRGRGGLYHPYHGEIDVGPAGTTMRFLTALLAFSEGVDVVLKGSARMHERPIADLVESLSALGADIRYVEKKGFPPLAIKGRKNPRVTYARIKGSVSSQFLSALLMISPLFKQGLMIEVEGEQVSKPYIDLTLEGMKAFGVEAKNLGYRAYRIEAGQVYHPCRYVIEGDASGATYFWGIAAIAGGVVRVKNVTLSSVQGDARFPCLLEKMGCRVNAAADWVEVQGMAQPKPLEVDMSSMPDSAQTLAVIASFAHGKSRIYGLDTLRVKETDRIVAVQKELARVGIESQISESAIIVWGGRPRGAFIRTYDDHRMAMSFAMLGSKVEGMQIQSPEVVNKSFPVFWNLLASLGVGVRCE